jgi:hypothetical protein
MANGELQLANGEFRIESGGLKVENTYRGRSFMYG